VPCARWRRRWWTGLLLAAVALSGCSSRAGAPDPASEQGGDVLTLYRLGVGIAAAITVLVVGLLLWVTIRYRQRDDRAFPPQRRENLRLEVAYTLVPLAIVAGYFAATLVTLERVDATPRSAVRVEVTGFRWQWRFTYPEDDVAVVGGRRRPVMVLPVGRPARIGLQSTDVVHSFYVPGFLIKRDLLPGQRNELTVTPTRLGLFRGYCAEFCGLDHARMLFDVRVVDRRQFRAFVAARRGPGAGVHSDPTAGGG
jgi:cytochrome c oxidase subunit II